jgi:nickel transport protein
MKTSTFIRELLLAGTIVPLAATASHASLLLRMPVTANASETTYSNLSVRPHVAPANTRVHGFTIRLVREGRMVVAECHYDGGTPVTGAQVTLYSPENDAPYQTGITDPTGVFVFLPNSPGEWRLAVDDGMGHRREASIQAAMPQDAVPGSDDEGPVNSGTDRSRTDSSSGAELPWKLFTGLGLIVGLTGFAYGFTARRTQGS